MKLKVFLLSLTAACITGQYASANPQTNEQLFEIQKISSSQLIKDHVDQLGESDSRFTRTQKISQHIIGIDLDSRRYRNEEGRKFSEATYNLKTKFITRTFPYTVKTWECDTEVVVSLTFAKRDTQRIIKRKTVVEVGEVVCENTLTRNILDERRQDAEDRRREAEDRARDRERELERERYREEAEQRRLDAEERARERERDLARQQYYEQLQRERERDRQRQEDLEDLRREFGGGSSNSGGGIF